MVHHPPSSGRQIGGVPDSHLQLSDGRELTGGTRIKVGRGVNYDGVATIQALFDGHGDLLVPFDLASVRDLWRLWYQIQY